MGLFKYIMLKVKRLMLQSGCHPLPANVSPPPLPLPSPRLSPITNNYKGVTPKPSDMDWKIQLTSWPFGAVATSVVIVSAQSMFWCS